jgi:hypothetical protein
MARVGKNVGQASRLSLIDLNRRKRWRPAGCPSYVAPSASPCKTTSSPMSRRNRAQADRSTLKLPNSLTHKLLHQAIPLNHTKSHYKKNSNPSATQGPDDHKHTTPRNSQNASNCPHSNQFKPDPARGGYRVARLSTNNIRLSTSVSPPATRTPFRSLRSTLTPELPTLP